MVRAVIHRSASTKRFDKCQGREMSEQGNLTRRRFMGVAGAAAASVLAPGLAGCAGGDSGGSSSSGGSGGGGDGGNVTLTWWDYFNDTNEKAVNERIAAYKKVKPNVTIKRTGQPFADLKQKLLQGATAGELPDIVVIDNPDHSSFAALGVLADLTEQVKAWGQEGEYFEGPWKSTVYEGKNYGVPDNSNCLALWANTPMCKQAGVDIPGNWDELRQAAQTLTNGKTRAIAMSAVKSEEGTFQWLPFLWAAGADLDSLDSDGGRQALQLWVDLVKSGQMSRGVVNWDQAAVLQQFENERAALMVNGPWQIPTIKAEKPKLKWQVATLPPGSDERVDPRRREHRGHQVLQARGRRLGLHQVDPGAREPDHVHRDGGQNPVAQGGRRAEGVDRGPGGEGVRRAAEDRPPPRLRAEVSGDLGRRPGHAAVRADG
jgi:ABC-type glycerol-3-phosphate transport system substrate-binding protein